MKKIKGFTLIELMVVVSIIGILAAIAIPQYQVYVHRSEVVDALGMGDYVKKHVTSYYIDNLEFPMSNSQTGVPDPDKLIGNRITSVSVAGGAIHIVLGHKASKPLQGKTLTFRPATVDGSPQSPVSWLCGYDVPVNGMTAVGANNTDISDEYLPSACRSK